MNLRNAIIILVATVIICLATTLLYSWPWINQHWIRQVIVAVFIVILFILGLYIAYKNLIVNSNYLNDK